MQTRPDVRTTLGAAAGPKRMAVFVSPHGFGHAARATAVMLALHERRPDLCFEVFTLVPSWFFAAAMPDKVRVHPVLTDVGMVQRTSLAEDVPATVRQLDRFLPFDPAAVQVLAELVSGVGCRGVLCDISPLGIVVARAAGLPSFLIENFTWDFIYRGYLEESQALVPHADALHRLFAAADYHVRTEPVCGVWASDLIVSPVSRPSRRARADVRAELGIPAHAPAVLLTMGGIPWDYTFLERLSAHRGVSFIVPGGSNYVEHRENVALIPHHSTFYHPDLVRAADAVIGKVGYSTVAEVYAAGSPFGFIARPRFPESPPMTTFIRSHMPAVELTAGQLASGDWLGSLDALLALPRVEHGRVNGSHQVAEFLAQRLGL